MSVATIKLLRWMSDNTLRDKIRNECIYRKFKVAHLRIKWENRLIWFGHMQRSPTSLPTGKSNRIAINGVTRYRGRPKQTWWKQLRNIFHITREMTLNRDKWKKKIHVANPKKLGYKSLWLLLLLLYNIVV